jgi:RND family efflux transporter MFP subunit
MNRARNIVRSSVVLFLLGQAFTACSGPSRADSVQEAKPAGPPAVAVQRVRSETLRRELTLTGEFRPYQSIDLHAKVAGYLKEILVDVGDRVKTGQLIATLEIPEMLHEVAQAAAEIRRIDAEIQRLRSEVERAEASRALVDVSYTRLVSVSRTERGLIAQQELDEAFARKRVADAQVSSAKAALATAQQQVEVARAGEARIKAISSYARITAPFTGVVTKRFADPGAMIQAGIASQTQAMPVVRLAEVSRVRMVLPIPESAATKVRLGAPVSIRVASLGRSFTGSISRFSRDLHLSTRTMDAEVDVPNPTGELMPGLYAEAVITLEVRPDAVTVPVQAVSGRDAQRSVLVVGRDGIIEERRVRLGMETASKAEVLEGLRPDEMVVIGSRAQLKIGQKVEAKLVEIG